MELNETKKNHIKDTKWHRFAVLPLNLFLMEVLVRLITEQRFFTPGLLLTALNCIVFGGLFMSAIGFFSDKTQWIILLTGQILTSLWYSIQTGYRAVFNQFLIWQSFFSAGGDLMKESQMVRAGTNMVVYYWWAYLLLFAVPLGILLLYRYKFSFEKRKWQIGLRRIIVSVMAYALVVLIGYAFESTREVATDAFNKERAVLSYGLLRAELLDLQNNVPWLRKEEKIEIVPTLDQNTTEDETVPVNQMDIDFSALAKTEKDETVRSLHEYFANEVPSTQNEYTGMFEGYNLIQITAESFSPYAIDEQLTPTLYKMYQNGFQFTNFYNPLWEVSTLDGEYTATIGLLPKSGDWSYATAGENGVNFPFTMVQQYLHSGVQTVRGYHNHTYSYYKRNISHPNLGYRYLGIGNGLEKRVNGKIWPESDLEMIEGTTADYLDGQTPFMTYYMTVSGHMEYSYTGNQMCAKNRKLVDHLPYSEAVRAYYACNIELDRAMEQLLADLEEAGVAERTLISIVPDHYPYGLLDKEAENMYHRLDELAGHKIDSDFELYKSVFLLYSPSMKQPVVVDKYCSSLDVIPTLNNLLGFEFDSRLLMGRDILSSSEPLVIFLNRSWITSKGRYNADTGEFTLFAGQSVEDEREYVTTVKKIVSNKFKVSGQMLDTDYFSKVVDRKHYYSK